MQISKKINSRSSNPPTFTNFYLSQIKMCFVIILTLCSYIKIVMYSKEGKEYNK